MYEGQREVIQPWEEREEGTFFLLVEFYARPVRVVNRVQLALCRSKDTVLRAASSAHTASYIMSSSDPQSPPPVSRSWTADTTPQTPLRHYFSRRSSLNNLRTTDLPFEHNAVGHYSPWGIFFGAVFLMAPLSYIYILLILLRELCVNFPETIYQPIQHYLPYVAMVVSTMEKSSRLVEAWCVIEALFYVCLKLHIKWLQRMDPLERSLSSAPMLTFQERKLLWQRMVEAEADDPVTFITGWFFDQPLESISKYDVRDFVVWSMFEGRNQEHLTLQELGQLEDFVDEIEWRISLQMYGAEDAHVDEKKDTDSHVEMGPLIRDGSDSLILKPKEHSTSRRNDRQPRPKQSKCMGGPSCVTFVSLSVELMTILARLSYCCSVSIRGGKI